MEDIIKKASNKITSLILWYLPIAFVQAVSGRITISSSDTWYKSLEKAPWAPPSWVFGPAWTILYLMMAVAVWIVSNTKATKAKHRLAYSLFFTQLFANALWPFLFFRLQKTGWALIDLGILIGLITATAVSFATIRRLAGFLLLPYLLWSLYAFTLNAAIWWLN